MDVIQAARELGKAIQEDGRFIRAMKAQDANDRDKELQDAISAFNLKRTELSTEVQKQDKDPEHVKQLDAELKGMYQKIFQNPNMNEYTDARNDMQEMLDFVNQIITGSANGQNPETIEYQPNCGGDCSGCAGC